MRKETIRSKWKEGRKEGNGAQKIGQERMGAQSRSDRYTVLKTEM